jgi:hypothetical protein
MKNIKKRRLIFELFIWLLAEIVLGYLELDNLADYSEYLKGPEPDRHSQVTNRLTNFILLMAQREKTSCFYRQNKRSGKRNLPTFFRHLSRDL